MMRSENRFTTAMASSYFRFMKVRYAGRIKVT